MENNYKASIIDMDVKTENRGTTARMFFTVNIMPETVDGKIDRVALTKKISDVTDGISKAIECSNAVIEEVIYGKNGEELHYRNGKPVPKSE